MKAVVYALSSFQQQVMPGLWKDITTKIHHKVSENWISTTLLVTPVVGTYQLWMVCGNWMVCENWRAFREIQLSPEKSPTAIAFVVHGLLGSGRNWRTFSRTLASQLRDRSPSDDHGDPEHAHVGHVRRGARGGAVAAHGVHFRGHDVHVCERGGAPAGEPLAPLQPALLATQLRRLR